MREKRGVQKDRIRDLVMKRTWEKKRGSPESSRDHRPEMKRVRKFEIKRANALGEGEKNKKKKNRPIQAHVHLMKRQGDYYAAKNRLSEKEEGSHQYLSGLGNKKRKVDPSTKRRKDGSIIKQHIRCIKKTTARKDT